MAAEPSRTPRTEVRRQLRQEVGFGCPVDGCGSPYLTWHHFDPPWRVRKHEDPEGIIALCREHHDKADHGAFTDEQLRALKRDGRERNQRIRGRFDWMRRDILAVAGGNFYYEVPNIIIFKDQPVIWWRRDEEGMLRLNIRMLTATGEPRARIQDNDWITEGAEADIESPPNGKRLSIAYPNGEQLAVEFREVQDPAELESRYETELPFALQYPLTTVEIGMDVNGLLSLRPRETLVGTASMVGCWSRDCYAGIYIA